MTTTSVLALPETLKPYVVYSDELKMGLGFVLIQEGRIVVYAYVLWNNPNFREATLEREDSMRARSPHMFVS